MPTKTVPASVRISVRGPQGRADLAVPSWMPLGTVAEEYARVVELSAAPLLTTAAGAVLDSAASVQEAGLVHGDVVVAPAVLARPDPRTEADAPADGPLGTGAGRGRGPLPGAAVPVALSLAGLCAVGAGGLAAVTGHDAARTGCAVLLLLCALVAAAPVLPVTADRARALSAVAPAFGAGGGIALVGGPGPGGLLLTLTVAALLAAVVAAVARVWLDDGHDEIVDAWLVVSGSVAVVSVVFLAGGASGAPLLAVLFAVAVAASRLLPYVVVDVPDQALLDLDRLAVTAWSAREQPTGSRRGRAVVRAPAVQVVARRGQRLVVAGTAAIAVAVSVTGPVLVLRAGHGLTGLGGLHGVTDLGALAMVGLGGPALSLVARSFRSWLPGLLLRAAGLWLLGFVAVDLLRSSTEVWTWSVFAGLALGAAVVVLAAVALGRGWRSVWWARVADVVEALTVVLVVAALPLASGLFDAMRAFTS